MSHVMADLETLGTKSGSVILSIGAVVFDPNTGQLGEKFYVNLSTESQVTAGLKVDPNTVAWWAKQSSEARLALESDQQRPIDGLIAFSDWFKSVNGVEIWGHGANFDPVLLEAAYEAFSLKAPWRYTNVRCCRTVLALANIKPEREGLTHHNALDDSISQANAVMKAYKQFFNGRE